MFSFQPADYGRFLVQLIDQNRLCDLGQGNPNPEVLGSLQGLNVEKLFEDREIINRDLARCCVSGLWMWFDYLEESHSISQSIGNSCGSYWHGIMHRREPDYSNAKYWFRRTGDHPIFDTLCNEAKLLDEPLDKTSDFLAEQTEWDPFRFVDLCELVARGRSNAQVLCQKIQRLEWQLLFDHCYRKAIGD